MAADFGKDPEDLVMVVHPEPVSLASFCKTQGPIGLVTSKIYEGLITFNEEREPVPCLARRWTVSPDFRCFDFLLRNDVTFHDGSPFKSDDVVFSIFETLKNHHPRGRISFENLISIETPDEHRAVFRFSKPAPMLFQCLSAIESPILPRRLGGRTSLHDYERAETPVGTGPFCFKRWDRGRDIVLEQYEGYHGSLRGTPRKLTIKFEKEKDHRTELLTQQIADIAGPGAVPFYFKFNSPSSITTVGNDFVNPVLQLDFNTTHTLFKSAAVRRALSSVISRDKIIEKAFHNFGRPMDLPLHSNWHMDGPDDPSEQIPFDVGCNHHVETENGLLDMLRQTLGRHTVTIDVIPYGPEWEAAAELVRLQLADNGITAAVRKESFEAWLQRIFYDYDFELSLNYVHFHLDPALSLRRMYHSAAIIQGATFSNCSRWHSMNTDDLFDSARNTIDPIQRATIYRKVAAILGSSMPSAWLAELSPPSMTKYRLHGSLGAYGSFAGLLQAPNNPIREPHTCFGPQAGVAPAADYC